MVLKTLDIEPDLNSSPSRVYIPQCPKFSNELCQTWAKVNSRFHVSSQCKPWTFMAYHEELGLDQYPIIDPIVAAMVSLSL